MRSASLIAALVVTTLAAGSMSHAATRLDPASFSAKVDNPWLPFTPGTTLVYRGVKDGKKTRDVVTVTHAVTRIGGVPCATVHDELYEAGRLEERTTDWYSQDRAGNVWYVGEATAELDAKGRVTSREGSWRTGVGGARPGVFMPAHPAVGRTGRQEYLRGHAEDHYRVVRLDATVHTPYVSSRHALETAEWTPLEPGVLDRKVYVRGIGNVMEASRRGPVEINILVSVTHT